MQNQDNDITIEDEWKYIALIIDRALMYIYCAAGVVGTIYYFCTIGNNNLEFQIEKNAN